MEKHPAPRMGTTDDVIGGRILAFLFDSIIGSVLMVALVLPFALLGESAVFLGAMLALTVGIVYGFLLEGLYGYTPGKYLLGLVVVKSDGSPCTIGASIVRNVLLIIDQLPFAYIVGLALIFLTDENQRVGDLVADTVVVRQQ